ncbi:Secretory immunoglobulin A-binding protein EsiB [Porphyridium purpureum]|uniref:Secretory immunoglobulin A-binding protein EsiB n=1 Tax=Porphyridium purpureum TaxID=35688 RepID=A0A5J4YIH4_PORPP|nr:Secretory immunoglobulin A-binding protein EsiB [Porphyridium purpureum]|eukprot:POR8514..scf219_40
MSNFRILEDPKRGVPWDRLNKSEYAKQWPAWVVKIVRACLQTAPEASTMSDIWLEFYDHMGVEGAIAAAKSRTAQNVASPSGFSTAKVDALSGEFSHVTVASGGSVAQSSSTGSRAAGPSGMRPVRGQAQALSADEHLRHAEDWEKAGNMAYAYEYFKLAAEAGVVEGQFRLGKILLDGSHGMRQHLEHGAGWVRAAAENGRTDAMIEYGRCHHSGRGVPQNWSLAKEWYAKAAKLGSSAGSEWIKALEAEEQTALRSRQLEDEKTRMQREREAEEHAAAARQAATEKRDRLEQERKIWPSRAPRKEARNFAARRAPPPPPPHYPSPPPSLPAWTPHNPPPPSKCSGAGDWQQRGGPRLDNKNFAQALVWYRKAAHVGDAYAQFKLGNFYQEGLGGLPQDMRAAVEWYCKAAEQGDTLAQKKKCVLKTARFRRRAPSPENSLLACTRGRAARTQVSKHAWAQRFFPAPGFRERNERV